MVDENNDWTFGRGVQSYAADLQALQLNLKTRVLSWVGDCFFDLGAGIDWKNNLDYGRMNYLRDQLKSVAFKTAGVLRVYNFTIDVSDYRIADIKFNIDTIYGANVQNALQLAIGQ